MGKTKYERKRHSPENRAFSAPLVRCSIAPVLLSLCRVAQLCRVARLCRFVFSAPLVRCSIAAVLLVCAVLLSLCNICAQETLSNELWPNLGNICAQETLSNELWPSLGNKLIKSNFWEKKNRWPGSWHSCSNVAWIYVSRKVLPWAYYWSTLAPTPAQTQLNLSCG